MKMGSMNSSCNSKYYPHVDSDSQLVTVYMEHALMTVNHVQLILESEGKQIIQLAEQHAVPYVFNIMFILNFET